MASASPGEKRVRGRPRTNPAAQHFTMPRDLSDALDAWIALQKEPKPSRPEAIRQLLQHALLQEHHGHSIDDKIAIAERVIAKTPIPKTPSPRKGLAMLKRGKAEFALAGLKAKKKRENQ